MKTVILLRNHD